MEKNSGSINLGGNANRSGSINSSDGANLSGSANIIELKHVTKRYDDNGFVAVNDFNLEVKRGEFVTFLGPSGCGKTTTLRMIAGFDIPTSGEILLNGKSITSLPPYERPINTVFQRYALFPHMNIYDNIAFGLRQKKMAKDVIEHKVKRMLTLVDLEGFENRSVATLSGGQQQRIAIARALVNEPEILLLDEPLGALDLKMRQEMQIELKAMHDKLGITFIYVTHDQEEALTMSDKIVVMSEGQIQQIGTPEDVYNEPKNAFVADFIGESNIFSGIMTGKLRTRFCGGEFVCVDDVPEGTHITAVIRPEDVELTTPEQGMIRAVVTSVIFKGMHYEITMQSGKNEIVARSTRAANVGDRVGIRVEPDGIHIMIAEDHTNTFLVDINKDYRLEYNGKLLHASLTKLIKGGKRQEDGSIVDGNGEVIDINRLRIQASIQPEDIEMTDNQEEGLVQGNISNLIYLGEHYLYIIHTDDLEQDFAVYDEDLWNMGDRVGLIMPTEKMTFTIKK
ncbi:MAG: polyamine ABC transporter ATP-binding protein [Oribacterium sp.]|jgi:spermidine/putrescine transport system ATP-binding protein|nr:polyamine ABC transporter ATP-binding protein [Oribacterium sp.]